MQSKKPLRLWRNASEAALALGIPKISHCITGKRQSAGKFGWRAPTPEDFELLGVSLV